MTKRDLEKLRYEMAREAVIRWYNTHNRHGILAVQVLSTSAVLPTEDGAYVEAHVFVSDEWIDFEIQQQFWSAYGDCVVKSRSCNSAQKEPKVGPRPPEYDGHPW